MIFLNFGTPCHIFPGVGGDQYFLSLILRCFSADSGATVITALNVLKEHGVKDKNVIMLTVFATPQGMHSSSPLLVLSFPCQLRRPTEIRITLMVGETFARAQGRSL